MIVATAGWSIPREARAALPTAGTGLERYATVLGGTEINSTFYRRHRTSTFERWRDSVPASFRFAVKLPRAITHDAALAAPKKALRDFFDDVAGLGAKLGPVLVQLPASLPFQARRVEAFFRLLRAMHSGPVACEPRNPSWYAPAGTRLFTRYAVVRVVADPPRPAAAAESAPGASFAYQRLHGSPRRYWSSYDDGRLEALVEGRAQLVAPDGGSDRDWIVFDNTASGAAWTDAVRLTTLLRPESVRRGRA